MEILLQSKTCVFMDDALMIKGGDKPVFYEQIAQVIYEKRYNSYDIVFYNEKNKKRTMQISFDDKENEEAILKILQEKVRNLEPRKAKHPIWKAGGLWITLYVLLAFIVLLKFFAGPFQNVSVPILLYPFFLLVNLVSSETFTAWQLVRFLLCCAGCTFLLCLFSYARSSIVIYEKKEL